MNKQKFKEFFKSREKDFIKIFLVFILIVVLFVVVSHFYACSDGWIVHKYKRWEYRYVKMNDGEKYLTIYNQSNEEEIIVPTEIRGHKIYDITSGNNPRKYFLTKENSNLFYIHWADSIILTSIDPKDYSNGFPYNKGERDCYYHANHRYVPKEYVNCYNSTYVYYYIGNFLNKDDVKYRDKIFEPANVSYMFNYEIVNEDGYYWEDKSLAKYDFSQEFIEKEGGINTTDDYLRLLELYYSEECQQQLEQYYEKYYKKFIDTSSFNGGYYWIDNLEIGDKIKTIPQDPVREGYKFTGWYSDSECTQAFDFNNYIKDENDLTLYANWEQL